MFRDSAGQVRYDITANADDFIDQLKAAGKAIDDFGDKVSEQDKILIMQWNNLADEFELAMTEAALKAAQPVIDFATESVHQISEMNKSIVSAGVSAFQTASAAAIGYLTNLGKKGIEGADNLAQYNAQVIGLANSTEDANSAMSAAVKFFKQNPFQRFETVEAVKNLMTYDKSIANAANDSAELTKTLDMLGIASLSSGTPLAELASKWGQVSSQARVSKGQFEELALRVPALYDAVGKRMGISASQVSEALNRVGIDTKVVKQAMEDLYGLDTSKLNGSKKEVEEYLNSLSGAARQSAEAYLAFGNTMARQTDRVKGRIADMAQAIVGYELTAEGGFKALEGGIYQSIINLKKSFADVMAGSTETAAKMRSAFGKLGKSIAQIIDKIAEKLPDLLDKLFTMIDKIADHTELLIPILAGAVTLFGNLASTVPIIGPAINKITGPLKTITSTFLKLNPALKIIFGLLGAGVFKAIKDGKLTGPLKSIFESLQKIGKALAPVIEQVLTIFANIGETVVVSLLESLAKVLEVLANVISSLPTEVLTGFVLALIGLKGAMSVVTPITTAISTFKSLKEGIIDAFNIKAKALGGIEKIKKVLNGVEDVSAKAAEVSDKAAGASSAMKSTSKSMSKVSSVLGTIMKGAGAVILIAVAIAAMAGALKLTHELLKDVNLGQLLLEMGTLVLVVGVAGLVMAGIGYLGKYAAIGAIASAIIGGGLLVTALALAETGKHVKEINLKEIMKLEVIIGIVSAILTVVATFAVFGAIGSIASAILSGGLVVSAIALEEAGKHAKNIDLNALIQLSEILAVVDAVLGIMIVWAALGAISSIADMIISGGLLVSAIALEETGKHVGNISLESILEFSKIIAVVDGILGALAAFAVLGAVGAVANDIIAGGLLVAAIALEETQKHSDNLKIDSFSHFSSVIVLVDSVLAVMSGFAVLGAISAVANDIIAGGLLVAAIALVEVGKVAININKRGIEKLNSIIVETDAILSIMVGFAAIGSLSTILNDVIVAGVLFASQKLYEASIIAQRITQSGIDKLQWALTQIASFATGQLFENLKNLINSNILSGVSSNVHDIVKNLSGLKPIKKDVIESLKENVEIFSKIKIEGSGLFENKGGAAEELEKIAGHVKNIATLLKQAPEVNLEKTQKLVAGINEFKNITNEAKDGINRLRDTGDALGKLDWVKNILGYMPEDIWNKSLALVNSIKLFDRIDDNARNGLMRLDGAHDALGNLDWIKYILGDVSSKLPEKAGYIVDAIMKFSTIKVSASDIEESLSSVKLMIEKITLFIESNYQKFYNSGSLMVKNIIDGIKSMNEILVLSANYIHDTIFNRINSLLSDFYFQGQKIVIQTVNGIKSCLNDFYQAGVWAARGFENGIQSVNLRLVGIRLANNFLNGFYYRAGQGSPWKTTYQSGVWAVEGLIEGIERMSYKLKNTAKSVADIVVDNMSIDNLADTIGFNNLRNLSMSISGQGEEGSLGGVNSKSNTINIYNNNYTQTDFNQMSRDIMFNISRL